jgi:hypothetical protein
MSSKSSDCCPPGPAAVTTYAGGPAAAAQPQCPPTEACPYTDERCEKSGAKAAGGPAACPVGADKGCSAPAQGCEDKCDEGSGDDECGKRPELDCGSKKESCGDCPSKSVPQPKPEQP